MTPEKTRAKLLASRGYIGPIGDDFPSLVPLIFGLLLFFTAFTITFDSFDRANSRFNDDIEMLRIARTMQSNSYIYSSDNFKELCSRIGVVRLGYVAIITADYANPVIDDASNKNIFDMSVFRNSENDAFFCTSTQYSGTAKVSDFVSLQKMGEAKVLVRVFPIAVEDAKVVKPLHLAVIAWR